MSIFQVISVVLAVQIGCSSAN